MFEITENYDLFEREREDRIPLYKIKLPQL